MMKKEWHFDNCFIVIAHKKEERALSMDIRLEVFVKEQKVPKEEEIDAIEDKCTHFLLYNKSEEAQATARLWITPEKKGKLQRIAVLKKSRGQGFGRQLVQVMEEVCLQRGVSELILGAQLEVMTFYEKLGYIPYGDLFDDGGIVHRMMSKK